MSLNVKFSNRTFERSHQRKPRGKGCWIFKIERSEAQTPIAVLHEVCETLFTVTAFKSKACDSGFLVTDRRERKS